MKRYMMTLIAVCIASMSAFAMGYEEARREALYLTDKMAYELNLNPDQYDYAYEINLDYLLGLRRPSDLTGIYYRHRCADLRDILHDWQYNLFLAADYFLRPVLWKHNCWHFPIYSHYVRDHFFYSRPRVYMSYRGGHGRGHHHNGFYSNRRPEWTAGLRGPHRDKVHVTHNNGRRNQGNVVRGNGYSFQLPDKGHSSKGTEQHAGTGRRPSRNESASAGRGNASVGRGNAPVRNESASISNRNTRPSTSRTTTPRVARTERGSRTQSSVARVSNERPSFKNSSTRTTVSRPSSSAPRTRVTSQSANRSSSKAVRNAGNASSRRDSRGGRGGR